MLGRLPGTSRVLRGQVKRRILGIKIRVTTTVFYANGASQPQQCHPYNIPMAPAEQGSTDIPSAAELEDQLGDNGRESHSQWQGLRFPRHSTGRLYMMCLESREVVGPVCVSVLSGSGRWAVEGEGE
jgi:hypothetical protein